MGSLPESGTSSLDVAIVGGGIAGLTLALGLLSRGIKTTIYERGRSFREIGAGIGFTPNAEWAMKVLDPRIHAAFKQVTVQNGTDWFIWMNGGSEEDGAVLHKMYLGERGFEGCARAEFLDELVKSMPEGTVQFSKNLAGIVDEEGQDKVVLKFADGSSAEADVVIGCDGIRSRVKQFVVGEHFQATYTHKYAFRGLIPMETAYARLGQDKTDTRHMYLGPDGHALTFPVAGGKLLNVVAFVTDPDEWPLPEKFTAPASKTDAVKAFARFNPTVRAIIDMLPDELNKWAVFDTYDHPAPTFIKGRVCISGDAAHAAAPYHGAGAGFAIEDGAVLAYLLSVVNDRDKALPAEEDDGSKALLIRKALEAYNAVRLERAHWLVQTSRYIGDMYEWQDPIVGSDPKKCADEIDWRCRKIWHYDIDAMMKETKEYFTKQLEATGSS
ncbi:putative salicylate hydroxylase [Delitschia confertaspora ATCC 74209]|uniref:Salicylate hydroxylase n=1 Tax=Delitschia confertaspora ATCC 74209 TaxID=1513339 RepID=A0A9P4MVQ8_9PLEO|nr:putative salicylate hydroxylase [Delitschia confertaspora ATCC 74209]